jgi:transposase InsO family protein
MAVLSRVNTIAAASGYRYGSRRMAKQLQDEGFTVGRFKARRLMTQAGVSARRRPIRRPRPTDSRQGCGVAPHLLARHFDVTAPHVAWCGDLPAVWTEDGWLYVAVLFDL